MEAAVLDSNTVRPDGRRPGRWLAIAENTAVTAALLAMMLLPLVEAALRPSLGIGIAASPLLVQHLTLVVGMLGAMIAARENRLLSLATTTFMSGRTRTAARTIAGIVAATVTLFLAAGSARFVQGEREWPSVLAYGIPHWVVQSIIPLALVVIALRIVYHSADHLRGRAAIAASALVAAAILTWAPVAPEMLRIPLLALLVAAAALGAPIFVVLGGAALILFWASEVPIAAIAVSHYSLVVNPALPAIPLFTLAGYLLAEGGASRRLVRLFDSVAGRVRGGPAVVTALACAFFTSFTGGSGVTILALGALLMPVLISAKYPEKTALGLLTGAGSLGLLFPPCLPLILYAIVAGVSLEAMFLGGIIPGTILVILVAAWGISRAPKIERSARFDPREAWLAVWDAKWEIVLPALVLVAIFGGFTTIVEAAALTAFYALVVETVIYRDYRSPRQISRVFAECGLLVGGVLLILGVALGFTNYLTDAHVPAQLVEWLSGSITSPIVFLLLLNVFLLLVGALMDIYSAIVVVAPLIVPLGLAFGIDPIHLGIIFLANLELGYLTPPVGMNLFLASYRFDKPLLEVYRAVVPMLIVLIAGVLLITYVPALTTFLPRLLGR
jgi:C4-dicarboxylate transporter, DctM subunit